MGLFYGMSTLAMLFNAKVNLFIQPIIWFQVSKDINPLQTIIALYSVIWFQVFLSNTNNLCECRYW